MAFDGLATVVVIASTVTLAASLIGYASAQRAHQGFAYAPELVRRSPYVRISRRRLIWSIPSLILGLISVALLLGQQRSCPTPVAAESDVSAVRRLEPLFTADRISEKRPHELKCRSLGPEARTIHHVQQQIAHSLLVYVSVSAIMAIALFLLLKSVGILRVKALNAWYDRLPGDELRELMVQRTSAHQKPRARNTDWRSVVDFTGYIHRTGLVYAFFPHQGGALTWTHVVRLVFFYFSPVALPYVALGTTILLAHISYHEEFQHFRFILGACGLAWASFAIPFFLVFSNRDFVAPARAQYMSLQVLFIRGTHDRNHLAEHIAYTYLQGRGLLVLNVLLSAMLPVLIAFASL